jgi:hypothetical protein
MKWPTSKENSRYKKSQYAFHWSQNADKSPMAYLYFIFTVCDKVNRRQTQENKNEEPWYSLLNVLFHLQRISLGTINLRSKAESVLGISHTVTTPSVQKKEWAIFWHREHAAWSSSSISLGDRVEWLFRGCCLIFSSLHKVKTDVPPQIVHKI